VRRGARAWVAAYLGVVAAFVATVATYYHPDFGFTRLIEFSLANHESEIAAVRDTPHYDDPASVGYDGQFYAQLAVDPLLRDPTIDAARVSAPAQMNSRRVGFMAIALLFSTHASVCGCIRDGLSQFCMLGVNGAITELIHQCHRPQVAMVFRDVGPGLKGLADACVGFFGMLRGFP